MPYGVGRLIRTVSGGTTVEYTQFDPNGRVLQHFQQNPQMNGGNKANFSYVYNRAGAMTSITYPSGRTVTTDYDNAGRTAAVLGVLNGVGKNYAGGPILYAPHGGVSSASFNQGSSGQWAINEQRGYNARLQPTSIVSTQVSSGQMIRGLTLGYAASLQPDGTGNNGNLLSQTMAGAGLAGPVSQTYAYDGANRIKGVKDGSCSRGFDYDTWGNGWVPSHTQSSVCPDLHPNTPVANVYDPANNRSSVNYSTWDAAGRQQSIGGYGFTYDAENRMTGTTLNGATVYLYDGDGRRVKKTHCPSGTPCSTVWYVYDAGGNLAVEYGQSTVASPLPCTTCYLLADHLGSTRVMTDQNGTAVTGGCHDYLPFGEEIRAGVSGRSAPCYPSQSTSGLRFTGKERDGESGLDYFGARYYSGAQGRFTSADPLNVPNLQRLQPEQFTRFISNPQNWNAYAYAHNNPLAKIDPDGYLTIVVAGTWNDEEEWKRSKFVQQVSKAFGEQAKVLNNPNMANTPQGRAAAAKAINELVAKHNFAEGEKLNIVAHSHGGNAVFAATQSGLTHKVDTLVTLGTPVRSDYTPNANLIGNHINVFSNFDSVQTHGGFSESMGTWGVSRSEMGPAGRTIGTATNVEAGLPNLGGFGVRNHSALWQNTDVWVKQVEPLLKK